MLRAYAIPCGAIQTHALTRDEEAALIVLVDALSTRVTFVLTRSELRKLSAAIERVSASLDRERLMERVMRELTSSGPGLQIQADANDRSLQGKQLAAMVKQGSVDAVLGPIGGASPRTSNGRGPRPLAFIDAAREVQKLPLELSLSEYAFEEELAALFRPLFRFGEELTIVDPYLGADTLRRLDSNPSDDCGLAFIVEQAARSAHVRKGRLALRLVSSQHQFKQAFKKLKSNPTAEVVAGLQQLESEDARQLIDERLRQRVCEFALCTGLPRAQVDVEVRWVPKTHDRGLISSQRVWKIEHSLHSLSELLTSIRKGKRTAGSAVRLQLLQDAGSDQIRSLARDAS
jgi:hypothetical protein